MAQSDVCGCRGRRERVSVGLIRFVARHLRMRSNERAELHRRIELRFENMMEAGFEHEMRVLYARTDLHTDLPSIRCVGYRQMWDYLDGKCTLEEAIFKGVCATRQLAKRQITWLRSWDNLTWLDSENIDEALERVSNAIASDIHSCV